MRQPRINPKGNRAPNITNGKRGRRNKQQKRERKDKQLRNIVQQPPSALPSNKIMVPVDLNSYTLMIESVMAQLAVRTDILTGYPTYLWYLYFYNILFMYVKQYGHFTSSVLPNIALIEKSSLSVPYPIAKWIEYLGPYKRGNTAYSSLAFDEDFTFISTSTMGAGSNTIVPRSGGVNWTLFTPAPYYESYDLAGQAGVVIDPPSTTSVKFNSRFVNNPTGTYPLNMTDFVSNTELISAMSSALPGVCDCIDACTIPGEAPDSSAYVEPSIPYSGFQDPPNTLVLFGFDYNFVAEISVMFAVGKTPTTYQLNRRQTRSVPNPLMSSPIPFYTIIMNTLSYLGLNQHSKPYKPGPMYDTMKYNGDIKLSTFYRRFYTISGFNLSSNIFACYQAIMDSKSPSGQADVNGLDPQYQFFWYFAAVSYYALQYQFNIHNMDNIYLPPASLFSNVQWLPQMAYSDNTWSTVNLPPLISLIISSIVPVVEMGALTSPVSSFANTFTSSNVPGPINWGQNGFNYNIDDYYGESNLYNCTQNYIGSSSAWRHPTVYQIGLGYVALNSNFDSMVGVFTDGSDANFYSYVLNGGYAQFIIGVYDQWWKLNQVTNVAPRAPPFRMHVGPRFATLAVPIYSPIADNSARQAIPIYPVQETVSANPTALESVSPNPDIIASSVVLDKVDALQVAALSLTDAHSSPNASATARRRLVALVSAAKQHTQFTDTESGSQVNYPFAMDPNFADGMGGVLFNLHSMFSDPNSPFAAELMKLNTAARKGTKIYKLIKKHISPFAENLLQTNSTNPDNKSNLPSALQRINQQSVRPVLNYLGSQGFITKETKNNHEPTKRKKFKDFLKGAYSTGKKAFEIGTQVWKYGEEAVKIGKTVSEVAEDSKSSIFPIFASHLGDSGMKNNPGIRIKQGKMPRTERILQGTNMPNV